MIDDTPRAGTRRLFIAVMLPREVQEHLAGQLHKLDAHRDIVRPVRPEALHFTLRFLGEISSRQEMLTLDACAAAASGVARFDLVIGGFGAFPQVRRPRVVWLGVLEGAAPLNALQRRVQEELVQRGVVARREEFTPHLTLARVREPAAPAARSALATTLAALPAVAEARCCADTVSLVHSVLSPRGSRYTTVTAWTLE